MRRKMGVAAILAAGVVAALVYLGTAHSPRGAPGRAEPETPDAALNWNYGSEEEWIVASVVTRMAELLTGSAGNARRFQLERLGDAWTVMLGAKSVPITSSFIWDAAGYGNVGVELKGESGAASAVDNRTAALHAGEEGEPSIVEALLAPTTAQMRLQNERLSAALEASPRSPALHAEAALLLGVLALRESAGSFSDGRVALSRATAHLAVARSLRGDRPPTVAEQLAELVLLARSGRQKDALARFAALEAAEPSKALAPWLRALKLRVTTDWRLIPNTARGLSLIEQLEAFRGLARALDDLAAIEFLSGIDPARTADWTRILLHAREFSVQGGNMFAGSAVALELSEVTEHFELPEGTEPELVARKLNQIPAGWSAEDPWVIDSGLWARFFQRHLMNALDKQQHHLRVGLGVKERATDHAAATVSGFAQFELAGLLPLERTWGEAAWGSACRSSASLARLTPERVPAARWRQAELMCANEKIAGALPAATKWFRPFQPWGTSFDDQRYRQPYGLLEHGEENARALEAVLELVGDDFWAADRLFWMWDKKDRTPEATRALFGSRLDYDVRAIRTHLGTFDADGMAHPTSLATRPRKAGRGDRGGSGGDILCFGSREQSAVPGADGGSGGCRGAVSAHRGEVWKAGAAGSVQASPVAVARVGPDDEPLSAISPGIRHEKAFAFLARRVADAPLSAISSRMKLSSQGPATTVRSAAELEQTDRRFRHRVANVEKRLR